MSFIQKLEIRWHEHKTLVCVGLDPDPVRFPEIIGDGPDAIFAFSRAIVDATADLVCAYKPQIAHFASLSAEDQLKDIIDYIHSEYPDVPVILDAKRGDIGSTAERYAREAFERYQADAVTVNPYLGIDGVKPFTDYADKGVILLCRTSNPSAREFQDLDVGGIPLYEQVATTIANNWNQNNNCALVVGATWPEQLGKIRKIIGDMPILVPGIGAQGGDLEGTLRHGLNSQQAGLIISSSRGVLYASKETDFAQAARIVVSEMNSVIQQTIDDL
ncbi:MAG: orotidine-5'-phosphate decarboxylase [Gammaproteobacteria bacterium]|nr:orotidine-5'-phosphate decarboxylase [Gammaproteobacteria bacterium]NNM14274.1 orotidine-5'-phosphate decarboxylase [Gammaproteobacteria bacterium]